MKRALAAILIASAAVLIGCGTPDTPESDGERDAPTEVPADDDDDGSLDGAGDRAPAVVAPGNIAIHAPKVGYTLETRVSGEGFESSSRVSVVGETKDAWRVELEGPSYAGYVMGLLVAKEDLRVTRAVLGKPGKVGQRLNVAEALAASEIDPGTPGEVSISIGSFACLKQVVGESTSWIGTEGELKGVLLKHDDPSGGPYELQDMPATSDVQISGCTLLVTRFTYTSGSEQWRTADAVVVALNGGLFKSVTPAAKVEVTGTAIDRKPRLLWQ